MDLTETFVSGLVSLLVEDLVSIAKSYIPYGGIDEKIKEWRMILLTIEAVLADAEERQLAETSIQLWLHDVQKLAYEIEDLLDDWATKAHRCQMIAEPESSRSSKIRKFISGLFSSITPAAISFNYDMIRKIDEITNRLRVLEKTKNILSLREYIGGKSDRTAGDLRLTSTSLVDPALVYGREGDSASILKLLLEDRMSDHDGKLRIISIVGMGGIGKTTLAQSLYSNEKVGFFFDDRAWVYVPEDFDPLKISKVIYEEVFNTACTFNDLNMVQVKLREKLSRKKFLLVLDDVWNQDYAKWNLLCAPFYVGAPGSAIMITTRSQDIAKTMGSNSKELHEVKALSDEGCLVLLARHAFQRSNFDRHPHLQKVGEIIAKRCQGLPLAAKSLGGLLRTKGTSKQWEEVSTSKIWELQSNDIMPALRLSYHHLPPYLKPIFVFCSIFPKGFEFDAQELILLWMAQGFLRQRGEKKQMEELGYEYFSELVSRSFFQPLPGNDSKFVMHDLNNDLAQFVAGFICCRLGNKMKINEQHKVHEEVRHISFISHKYTDFKIFKAVHEACYLRTLFPVREQYTRSFLSEMTLRELPKFPCLRVLSLSGYELHELPKLVDSNHLRYLDFSWTKITELPESVCDLHNLQTVLLNGCSELVQLPTSIHKLFKLRHLGIVKTPNLKEMPAGIGQLTNLRSLAKFIVDKSIRRKLSELKGLHHLQGTLSITGMENVINVRDVVEANLIGKEGLRGLEMKWSSSSSRTRDGELELEILCALKPTIGLECLEIEFYQGQKFPSWIGDRSYCNMVKVKLIGCENCVYLPSLGNLASLKELYIEGMKGVKVVGTEFFGDGFANAKSFESLVKLTFRNMSNWGEWSASSTSGGESFNGSFPCLHELRISGCRKLNKFSLPVFPSLGSLYIMECDLVVLRILAGLCRVKLLNLSDISGLNELDEEIIQCLREVENLRFYKCDQLRYLWEEEVACQVLQKMKSLTVTYCQRLESLGKGNQVLPRSLEILDLRGCDNIKKSPNWRNNVTSLRRLTIEFCKKLQNLGSEIQGTAQSTKDVDDFCNLESVNINECPCLKYFPTGKKLSTNLKELRIWSCETMEEPEVGEKDMHLLESLNYCYWSNVKSLPQGFTHLTILVISDCNGLKSIIKTSLPPTLITIQILCCKNLEYICADQMQTLTSLRGLTIIYCENLESYPSGGCWPPNLESLMIGHVKKSITEWGLARLPTSLCSLDITGEFPQIVSFSLVGYQLPTTISSLFISDFQNLEYLGKGIENLLSLEHLSISCCHKLRELPETLLPTLSSLHITECPAVQERCKDRGDYWPSISHIPHLSIN